VHHTSVRHSPCPVLSNHSFLLIIIYLFFNFSFVLNANANLSGVYCGGWVGTGPVGVIVSTMGSAFELGRLIEHDLKSGTVSCITSKPGFTEVAKLLDTKGIINPKL
jgi:hypothetical protein